ncbi:acyl-CoA dehydrogenase family protein [Gordonia humi]|uniref:Alkylation response protein AidB-like acyl-CoA dehydrogenase n=1 Tax=Gordonia humi TaxID=686429 RepID=A0A840EM42_9ACTN|nr:acyl-CoA dehydrogenase family protein [Gordonia humi]MBB4133835.1 alkylation response protein AidB-like acyl-CoA dehydrogenase [Gordonia humi]
MTEFAVFTDEQNQLRELVRDFLREKSPESEVRRLMATDDGYDPALWQQMAQDLGLHGLAIPEQYGGHGASWIELGIVLEEMGRALFGSPFFSTVVLAATALIESGDEEAKQRYLPAIADGSLVATVAVPEHSGRWGTEAVSATATHTPDGWTVTGDQKFVLDGATARLIIVPARTASGISLFAVDTAEVDVPRTRLTTLDQTRKFADVQLTGVPVRLIGSEGGGQQILERLLDFAVVALAAEQAGGAQAVLDTSTDYLKTRVQFGQAIGAFQALKHMAADVLIEVESAKSAAYYAVATAAEDNEEFPAAAALAQAYCAEAFVTAAHQNIQFHGGMGFTWEVPAHLYFKRARSSELLFGDADAYRAKLAQRIGI